MKVVFLLLLGICSAWAMGPHRQDIPSFQRPQIDPQPPPFQRPHIDPVPPQYQRPFRGRRDVDLRPAARPAILLRPAPRPGSEGVQTLPGRLPDGRTGQLPPKHTLTRPSLPQRPQISPVPHQGHAHTHH